MAKQVIAIHRGYCSTHKEGHVVEFEGPALTDPGLERLAIAIRRALRNEGYEVEIKGDSGVAQQLFRIRRNGQLENIGYGNMFGACSAWKENSVGAEVVRVDGSDNVLEVYTTQECDEVLRKSKRI